jgi:hypothetical protein
LIARGGQKLRLYNTVVQESVRGETSGVTSHLQENSDRENGIPGIFALRAIVEPLYLLHQKLSTKDGTLGHLPDKACWNMSEAEEKERECLFLKGQNLQTTSFDEMKKLGGCSIGLILTGLPFLNGDGLDIQVFCKDGLTHAFLKPQ